MDLYTIKTNSVLSLSFKNIKMKEIIARKERAHPSAPITVRIPKGEAMMMSDE